MKFYHKKYNFFLGDNSACLREIINQAFEKLGEKLMVKVTEAIKAFQLVVTAQFDRMGENIDGLVVDVSTLKEEIIKLQEMLADVDLPEEAQAILDSIVIQTQAVADRVKTLDDETPPMVPVEG